MNKVLITGASGLIGSRLTDLLRSKKIEVAHLGRTSRKGAIPTFVWDIEKNQIDKSAFADVDAVVHLAGAGVADKRWTIQRKKEILESRIKSTQLLYQTLKDHPNQVKTVVAASAIGFYGFGMSEQVFRESDKPGHDFLASVTQQWEAEVDKISALGIRVVKIRIGIVLSSEGGALVEIAKPVKWWVGAPLATGKQMLSWIHIDDLCEMFTRAITDAKLEGAYNGVAPNPVDNREMTAAIARVFKRPLWLPSVPPFVLNMLVGEMANMVINGSNVSADRIISAGFEFKFPTLELALRDLLTTK